jgi:hypothetical protein
MKKASQAGRQALLCLISVHSCNTSSYLDLPEAPEHSSSHPNRTESVWTAGWNSASYPKRDCQVGQSCVGRYHSPNTACTSMGNELEKSLANVPTDIKHVCSNSLRDHILETRSQNSQDCDCCCHIIRLQSKCKQKFIKAKVDKVQSA